MFPTESPVSWSYQKDSTWRQVPVPLPGLGPLAGVASFLANLPLLGTILALIVLVVVGAVVLAAVVLFVVLGPISIPKELPSATAKTTTVYAPDGSVVTSWHGAINRQPVTLDRISKYLPQAFGLAQRNARVRELLQYGLVVPPRDHPGASSGSIVHKSGKPAFSASAIVCCTLVSAISNVYTPATAIPCVCACSMIAVASASDLANTS